MTEIEIGEMIQENPPVKLQTDRSGSKYDKFIEHCLENRDTWFKIASAPRSKRNSLYSTASAIRSGRLGNIPAGEKIEVMVRRVDDVMNLYMRGI